MSNFQLGLIICFGVLAVFAVLVFAGILPGFRTTPALQAGELVLWGSLPEAAIADTLTTINKAYEGSFNIRYVAKNPARFATDFVNELANGRGPDLLIIPHELLWHERERLQALPYESLSQRDFLDTFADVGEIYLWANGTISLPLVVDPLVLYYNRDALRSGGLASPPANWTKLIQVLPDFVTLDERRELSHTALPLGEFGNITYAKDIFSLLLLQAGNRVVGASATGGWQSTLGVPGPTGVEATSAVLNFFTQFASANKAAYSWHSALPPSRDAFASGFAAFYLGYASDAPLLAAKNPHLKFDVALPPQRSDLEKLTFGRLYGVTVTRASQKKEAAWTAAWALSGAEAVATLAGRLGLPPARQDLLASLPADPAGAVFYKAAIASAAWLDPDPVGSEQIFRRMVTAVKTGELPPGEAALAAGRSLNSLISSGQ